MYTFKDCTFTFLFTENLVFHSVKEGCKFYPEHNSTLCYCKDNLCNHAVSNSKLSISVILLVFVSFVFGFK